MRIARIAFNYGDLDLAEKCYQRAIIDAQALGKIDDKMRSMLELSRNVYMIWDGRHEEAKNNYQSIYEYSINLKDYNLQTLVLSELANYYDVTENNYDKSLRILNKSLSILEGEQPKNQYANAAIQYQIASVLKKQKKYELALEKYEDSLKLFTILLQSTKERSDSPFNTIIANIPSYLYQLTYNIADISRIKKDYDTALKLYDQSLLKANQLGSQLAIAETLMGIARLNYELGNYDEALKIYKERLTIEENTGHQLGIAVTCGEIGMTYKKKNMNKNARKYLEKAISILKELGHIEDAEKFQVDLNTI